MLRHNELKNLKFKRLDKTSMKPYNYGTYTSKSLKGGM